MCGGIYVVQSAGIVSFSEAPSLEKWGGEGVGGKQVVPLSMLMSVWLNRGGLHGNTRESYMMQKDTSGIAGRKGLTGFAVAL